MLIKADCNAIIEKKKPKKPPKQPKQNQNKQKKPHHIFMRDLLYPSYNVS